MTLKDHENDFAKFVLGIHWTDPDERFAQMVPRSNGALLGSGSVQWIPKKS